MFLQVVRKLRIVRPAVALEQFRARRRNIHAPPRLLVAQSLARRTVISTQPSIGLHRRAIRVERQHIRGHWSGRRLARISMNAIQRRGQFLRAEQFPIRQHHVDGPAPGGADRELAQRRRRQRHNARPRTKPVHDFLKIPRQLPLPDQRVHACAERCGHQRGKTLHPPDTRVICGQRKWFHRRRGYEISPRHAGFSNESGIRLGRMDFHVRQPVWDGGG